MKQLNIMTTAIQFLQNHLSDLKQRHHVKIITKDNTEYHIVIEKPDRTQLIFICKELTDIISVFRYLKIPYEKR